MSTDSESEVFVFAGYSVNSRQRLLFAPDGRSLPLSARAFDVLLYLVQHPNQLIEKQRLMKAVWPNVIVEENNLNQNISIVRRALGETAGEHRFVVTVPGRGFRFVPEVKRLDAAAVSALASMDVSIAALGSSAASVGAATQTADVNGIPEAEKPPPQTAPGPLTPGKDSWGQRARSLGARSPRRLSGPTTTIIAIAIAIVIAGSILWAVIRTTSEHTPATATQTARQGASGPGAGPVTEVSEASVAVLPFADLSPTHDQGYFSDGLSEELLNQLAKVPGLRVIGRTSSFAFKGKYEDLRTIGEALRVNHIVEGSVRKSGNTVRIQVQLINPADGSDLWSNTYDRNLNDIFAVQEEIAKTVAGTLRLSIGALDLSEGGTRDFAAYDAYLSGIAFQFQGRGDSRNAISRLERAVAIDPNFAVGWAALMQAYQEARLGDPERSQAWRQKWMQAANRVVALSPNSAASTLVGADRALQKKDFAAAGRLFEAIAKLPPGLSAQEQFRNCLFLSSIAHSREAVDCWERLVQFEPFAALPSVQLLAAYDVLGDTERAETEYKRVLSFAPANTLVQAFAIMRAMESRDAVAARRAVHDQVLAPVFDNPNLARQALRRLQDDPKRANDPMALSATADWAAYFDDPELALAAIRKTYIPANGPDITIIWTVWRPLFKDMRRLPGFKDFVREIGLVDYWRSSGDWGEFCRATGTDDFECH